jgi:crotonobetainyl-CoA:carnitine CoA-transferase CaiB-like acyl-CoA transferase
MFDTLISVLSIQASAHLNAGRTPRRTGNRHPTIAPYDMFSAADGEFFLAVGNDDQFHRFCQVAGLGSLPADPRYSTNPARIVNHVELRAEVDAALRQRPRGEWIARLTAADVPCGSVRDIPEALADAQIEARQMIEAVEHASAGIVKVLGVPLKLSHTPGSVRTAPPTLGQHTDTVLMEIGFDAASIARLRAQRVV